MRFCFHLTASVLRTCVIFLAGALLLAAVYPSFSCSLSASPVSYTKEGWMRGTLTVFGHPFPVDLRDAADFFSRFRKEGEPDALEAALKAVSSDLSRAFFRAFDESAYVPEDAVLT